MDYDKFIEFVDKYQTERIKPLSLPQSCVPEKIPTFVGHFLADVFSIIESHFNELSDNTSAIGIFSLQPVSLALNSDLPTKLNRICHFPCTNSHVCCVLSYLPISIEDENKEKKHAWSNAKRLVIDFTRGVVMNEQRYLHELFNQDDHGKLYGKFNEIKLSKIWNESLM